MAWRVASPLMHDGVAYAPGDVVASGLVAEAQVAHLVSTGTLVLVAEPEAESSNDAGTGEVAATPPPASSRRGPRKQATNPGESEDGAEDGAAEQADSAPTSPAGGTVEGGAA